LLPHQVNLVCSARLQRDDAASAVVGSSGYPVAVAGLPLQMLGFDPRGLGALAVVLSLLLLPPVRAEMRANRQARKPGVKRVLARHAHGDGLRAVGGYLSATHPTSLRPAHV
jgi:hypothetical protein